MWAAGYSEEAGVKDAIDVMTLLIDRGAKLDEQDDQGRTALMLAAMLDHAAAAEALLAQDALIFESGEDERSKTEYAAKHLPADIEFSKAVGMEVTRRSGAADNRRAWVATEARIRGTWHGKPVDRSSTETMVLRLEAGSWKIAHIHWSSSPAR
jgi:ankyrin repeat protein